VLPNRKEVKYQDGTNVTVLNLKTLLLAFLFRGVTELHHHRIIFLPARGS
jgi:hypothetical protein